MTDIITYAVLVVFSLIMGLYLRKISKRVTDDYTVKDAKRDKALCVAFFVLATLSLVGLAHVTLIPIIF